MAEPEEKKKRKKTASKQKAVEPEGEPTIIDELGVEGLNRTYFRKFGREFAAAGKKTPVAEFTYDGLLMHSPDKPFTEPDEIEEIMIREDEQGISLNELGERRKIAGARYKGREIYWLAETQPGTTRHLVAWFDDDWRPHKLFIEGVPMTTDMIFKARSRTINGEIGGFNEITTD